MADRKVVKERNFTLREVRSDFSVVFTITTSTCCWLIDYWLIDGPAKMRSEWVLVLAQVHKKKLLGRHPGPHFGRQIRDINYFLSTKYSTSVNMNVFNNFNLAAIWGSQNGILICANCLKSSLHNLNLFWTLNSNNFYVEIIAHLFAFSFSLFLCKILFANEFSMIDRFGTRICSEFAYKLFI